MANPEENAGVACDKPAPHVARIILSRPQVANALDTRTLYALNDAFDRAAQDSDVRVIILAAAGKNFCAGHDLREELLADQMSAHQTVGTSSSFDKAGIEGHMSREEEIYLDFSERWRNIPKPTIAAIQGKCIAGGLKLAWACDLIVCAENAEFVDPTTAFGFPGVEFFMHPWELGARRAKEMLFTSDSLSASDAYRIGMVSRVVPSEKLETAAISLAAKIGEKSAFALKMAKKAINHTQDVQGRRPAIEHAFYLHQLSHAHWLNTHGQLMDIDGLPEETNQAKRAK